MLHGIRRKLAGWLDPETISRSITTDGQGDFSGAFAQPTLAGPAISERSALSIAAVWSAVSIYVNTIGALDLYIAEKDDRGGRKPAYDHPAYDLLHRRPNRLSTSMRFRQAIIGHALTHGNGYAEIEWDARGRHAVNLHLMDPRDTRPHLNDDGTLVYELNRSGECLPAQDVIHIAMYGWDGIRGYCPITIGHETLGVAAAQRTYQAGLYGNSAAAQGHVEFPGTMNSKQQSDFRDNWNRTHQGPQNAGNVGILTGGAKWVQTNFSPQDAEMILGAHFSVEEVARLFNLPQHLLGLLDHANFSTLEEQNNQFYQMSILPWLVAIEQECDNKLLGPIERQRYFIHHDVSTLLRGNTAAQTAQETTDLANGVRSINEVRISRGYNPLDDPNADKHWIMAQNNLSALEDMGKTVPEPVTVLDPDQVTDQDPTATRPVVVVPKEASNALRGVFEDAVGRMFRKECQAIRRAADKPRFDVWAIDFYARHSGVFSDAIAPACRALATNLGGTVTSQVLAGEWAYGSLAKLKGLWTTTPPDEMPAAVDRVCREWEADRVKRFVDYVAGAES